MASNRGGKPLSPALVKNIKETGIYGDGRGGYGLQLKVSKLNNGRISRIFRQKLTIKRAGKKGSDLETTRTIGPYPAISLKEARDIAERNAALAHQGKDPNKVQSDTPTVRELAPDILNKITHPRGRIDAESALARYVFSPIGDKPIDSVSTRDLYNILLPIYQATSATGPDVATLLKRIFALGETIHEIPSPMTEGLLKQMPPRTTPIVPHPSLPYPLIPSVMQQIDQHSSNKKVTCAALKTIILTGLRLASAVGAQWDEFHCKRIENKYDWDPATGWEPVDWTDITALNDKAIAWTVPASRMKAKSIHARDFRVPVSSTLLKILLEMLEEIGKHPGNPKYIFPGLKCQGHLSVSAVPWLMTTMQLPSDTPQRYAVTHGFRSTLREWSHDHKVPYEVAELSLSHQLPSTTRRYLRTDLLRERAPAMEAWGEYAEGRLPANWLYDS